MKLLMRDVMGLSGLSAKVCLHLLPKDRLPICSLWDAEVAMLAQSARHKCIYIANV